jgi:hypothetical protein
MNHALLRVVFAFAVSGGAAGCGGGGSDGLGTPTLTGIVVSPHGPTVDTAGSQRFTAVGSYSDGSEGAVSVTWSATSGTIDQNGFYRPAQSATQALVIAKLQNGSFADTAIVEVTALPPPNPGYPHEPAGFTKLTERSFTALSEDGWDAVDASGSVNNFTIQSDAQAPKSPPGVGQVLYPVGFDGGGEPVNVYKYGFTGKTRMYVSFWVRFSPNWIGHPSGVNKIFHFIINNINKVFLSAQGSDNDPLQATVFLQQVPGVDGRRLDPNLNSGSAQIVRGHWHRWELLLTTNTAGEFNGSAEWWIDGVRVGSYSDIAYVTSGEPHTWDGIQWAPTWGGGGSQILVAQNEQVDHIYISGAP